MDKSEFEKSIQYIEYIDDNKKNRKFSLSKYNKNNNTGYYYCSDTSCNGKAINIFSRDKNKDIIKNIKNDEFKLEKNHSLDYEEHSYTIKDIIVKDYQTINNFELKNKFKNYKYLKLFLRYYLEKNDDIGTSMIKFLYKLTKEFNEININYNLIPKDEEIKIINTFKKRKKILNKDIKIEDVINLQNLCVTAINNCKYKYNINSNFDEQLLNFKINNIKVVNKLIVKFKRKKNEFTKYIYSIMTQEMEENISSEYNSQFFSDVTYYCIPPNNCKYKLFILLSFNNQKFKTTLCNISMICNENIETFITLFDYLKNRYKFNHKYITTDFSKAEILAYKSIFSETIIIPCFYHY